MNEVSIKYNPYLVKSEFLLGGEKVDKLSNFYDKQENVRLQEWIEPSGEWKGLFAELYDYFNSSEKLHITFRGTELDFKDLKYASEKYGSCFKDVNFTYIPSKDQKECLKKLKEQFKKLQNGPIEELRNPKIKEAFEKALSSEFEIVVVAPMSSGKSTLINSMLGTTLLPEANAATTATITRIKDVDELDSFIVSCKDKNGKVIAENKVADLGLITKLNKMADDKKNINLIDIRGNIPFISSDKINIVFVDTPGGNNSQDREHKEVMKRAIKDENKGMILFVFNFTQLGTVDCDSVLEMAAQAMENARTGKQSRDRFIFVCNKMDEQDPEKETMDQVIKKIKEHLKKKNIMEPNIFLTDARVCKLARMTMARADLTECEEDILDGRLRPFNRESRRLFKYAPIPQEKKDELEKEVEDIYDTGDKRNLRVAEINSGVPALEIAISQYIEKYAQAIKVKTVHDVFMNKVEELNMKAKCEAKWSESKEAYEKVRKELEEKKKMLQKDQNLQAFKNRVDSIKADYSKVEALKERLVQEIMNIPYSYDEKIKKSEANALLENCHKDLIRMGEKMQWELKGALENCVYKECKKIMEEYQAYILELDRKGLLNIGEYSFKKIDGFNKLSVENLENISSEYVKEEVVNVIRKEKKGFFNIIKRIFSTSAGWENEYIKEEFVELRRVITDKISHLEEQVLDEVDKEINRAKENEQKVKNFANAHLNGIKKKVEEEMANVEKVTKNEVALKANAEKNKENMKWLSVFVDEMSNLLDV